MTTKRIIQVDSNHAIDVNRNTPLIAGSTIDLAEMQI